METVKRRKYFPDANSSKIMKIKTHNPHTIQRTYIKLFAKAWLHKDEMLKTSCANWVRCVQPLPSNPGSRINNLSESYFFNTVCLHILLFRTVLCNFVHCPPKDIMFGFFITPCVRQSAQGQSVLTGGDRNKVS